MAKRPAQAELDGAIHYLRGCLQSLDNGTFQPVQLWSWATTELLIRSSRAIRDHDDEQTGIQLFRAALRCARQWDRAVTQLVLDQNPIADHVPTDWVTPR